MNGDTMKRETFRRHGVIEYPRPEKMPNPHGPAICTDFADYQRCGLTAAKKRLEGFRETLTDLVSICRTNPVHREWLARTIAEAVAVCGEPVEQESPVTAYAAADGETEEPLVRYLENPTEANERLLLRTLRLERSANATLERHLIGKRLELSK